MSSKSLWGPLPGAEGITTPTQILKEQAQELSEQTKGVLHGDVSVAQYQGNFTITLAIQAPFVDNYEYEVLKAAHTLDLYPVAVSPGWDPYNPRSRVECADREEFQAAIGTILSAERIKRVIASLLAQSRS
jgi:hypothetical protein